MTEELEKIIQVLSHSGSLKILKAISKRPARQKDIIALTKLDKTIVWRRLNELFDLGLIRISFSGATSPKLYELTPLGQRIVQLLEQMEAEFEKYHSQAPPKDPEKFIGELMGEDRED